MCYMDCCFELAVDCQWKDKISQTIFLGVSELEMGAVSYKTAPSEYHGGTSELTVLRLLGRFR